MEGCTSLGLFSLSRNSFSSSLSPEPPVSLGMIKMASPCAFRDLVGLGGPPRGNTAFRLSLFNADGSHGGGPCIQYLQDHSKLSFLFPNSIKEPLIRPRFVVMSP